MIKKYFLASVVFIFFLLIFSTQAISQNKANRDSLSLVKHKFANLRYEEDWSYLKDTALKTEALDALKFIPLNASKSNYLSIGGETRLRFEYFHNENLGASPYQNNAYFQQRTFLHADVHLSKLFRIFTQLNSSTTSFRQGGPRPIFDKDVLDINQAFFDIHLQNEKVDFTTRVGRQELQYGNGKLVEPREGPNQRLAFDALRFILKTRYVKLETFLAQPVLNKQNVFDNVGNRNTTFWGVYSTFVPCKAINLDLYYFGIENKMAAFEKGNGKELRHTFGFKLNGKINKLKYETENFVQVGSFSNYDIFAYAFTGYLSYNLPNHFLNSKIDIGGAISSGDNGISSKKLGTFNALFPTGFYFGPPAIPIGPANLKAVKIALTSTVNKRILFLPSWGLFWRNNANDGIYTPAATLFKAGNSNQSSYIGNQLNITLMYKINSHITFMPSYAIFSSGDFIKQTGASKKVTYVNADLTFKF